MFVDHLTDDQIQSLLHEIYDDECLGHDYVDDLTVEDGGVGHLDSDYWVEGP